MEKTISRGAIRGRLTPPCSKSYAQRALAASLLAEGRSTLRNIEFCDDTLSAVRCIETLGARVSRVDDHTLIVDGGLNPTASCLNVGESGLSSRLFTPIAALCRESIRIEGRGTLLERPMSMMIDPLRELGAEVHSDNGYLPIDVRGPLKGGEIEIDGSVSSQFITGLLIALPRTDHETILHVSHAVSRPYLDMTIDAVDRFGVGIEQRDYREFYIEGGQSYMPIDYAIEGDWSAAAMMLVAGAVSGEVAIENIEMLSKQADTAVISALLRAGCMIIDEPRRVTAVHRPLSGFEFDATDCPDLFPALAALAASAEGVTRLVGTSRLEHKECNRAEAIQEEFGKLGIEVDLEEENVMKIRGGKIRGGRVSSHHDHRMAMALAVAALNCDSEVTIEDAECVAKSYPRFFEDLESIKTTK